MSNKTTIDGYRIVFFLLYILLGCAAGWFGQPLIHGNGEAVGIIVNVFAILAGFLVTIMTLLGDPGLYRGRTWRSDAVKKSNVYRRLVRHKWLFILYLSVLGLVFLATLILKKTPDSPTIIWLERFYVGMATVAFILSMALPHRRMNLQMSRFEEMIESRRKGADDSKTEA